MMRNQAIMQGEVQKKLGDASEQGNPKIQKTRSNFDIAVKPGNDRIALDKLEPKVGEIPRLPAPKSVIMPNPISKPEETPRSISNPPPRRKSIAPYPLEADGITPKYKMPSANKIRQSQTLWAAGLTPR